MPATLTHPDLSLLVRQPGFNLPCEGRIEGLQGVGEPAHRPPITCHEELRGVRRERGRRATLWKFHGTSLP